MIHTVKGFGIVNKAEIDVFLELSCFIHDPVDVGNLISGSSAFSKASLNIWKFTVHVLLKPGLENFKQYFTSLWDEHNCAVVWAFFGIAFLWDWNENGPYAVLWPLLSFPNLLAYWVQHFNSIIFQDLKPRSPALQADSLPSEPAGKPKNTGVGILFLFQGNFMTQESNRGLLHRKWIRYQLSYQGRPRSRLWKSKQWNF